MRASRGGKPGRGVVFLPRVTDSMATYKLRDKATGLFSTGGTNPRWTKKGKVWTSAGALKSHLTLFSTGPWNFETKKYDIVPVPDTWEVVTFLEVEGGS